MHQTYLWNISPMNIRVICKLSLPHITSKHHAATQSLQSCPMRPHRQKPTRPPPPRPWDSPGKNTGVGCHFLLHSIIRFFKCSAASTHLPHLTHWPIVYALITSLKATLSYKLIWSMLSMLMLWTIIQILSPFP